MQMQQINASALVDMMRLQHHQSELMLSAITALTNNQSEQAKAYQKQVEQILNIWNQPPPPREEDLRSPREAELLRDLRTFEKQGDPRAKELLNDSEQLAEYLSLFRDS
jgi:hypothetical protein